MKLAELLRELIAKNGVTFSRQYLEKLVKKGAIPYTMVDGKKDFDYKQAVKALGESQQKSKAEKDFNPKDKDGNIKTINSTKIMLQDYQALLAQQKFDIENGKLVYREDVENKAFIVGRVIRDQILAIPERLAGEIASTTDVREVKELMYKEFNQVLEYISDEKVLYE
mgnify:CR=1 FL=1